MRFATDASLGKLGRLLRSAGFDTQCEHQSRDDDFLGKIESRRVILTRTRAVKQRFRGRRLIFIQHNDPLRQMLQVVRELNIRSSECKPFSRCLSCNRLIQPIDRQTVKHRVPAYVWQRHSSFHGCDQCRRIYWAGSHQDRMGKRLSTIFQKQESETHERTTIQK